VAQNPTFDEIQGSGACNLEFPTNAIMGGLYVSWPIQDRVAPNFVCRYILPKRGFFFGLLQFPAGF